jgi:hypothetical protein
VFAKLEVQVDDKYLTIWYRSMILFRMWIGGDGQPFGRVYPDRLDMSEQQPPMSGTKRLEVHLLTKKKDEYHPMALPRLISQRLEDETVVKPEERRRTPSSGSSSGPLIDSHAVSNVLNAVLDSELVHAGNDDKNLRALESRRIAIEEHVGIGSVAAVRANFTRGSYGDPETLLQTRLTWLTRNEPERLRKMIEDSKGGTC